MKISTRGRYAIRLMMDLADNQTGEPVKLKDAAKRQGISEKYLEQIISVLNKNGFVRSVRGAQGGYLIARDPSEYTVGMILRATEGSLSPVECVDDLESCEREAGCAARILWGKIADAINQVTDSITLQDLVDWQGNGADNYVI